MRKLFFVLFTALLVALTGCQSSESPDTTTISSSLPDSAEMTSGTSSVDADRESRVPEGTHVSSAGNISSVPSSDAAEKSSSASQPDTAGTTSRKSDASAEQKPTVTPGQTNSRDGGDDSVLSAPVSSNPPVTPPSEEKPPASNPEVSEQPEPEKSIYDFPFDIEQIKAEMVQIGVNEMGWRYRTHYNDGRAITPDNSSWSETVIANQNIQGERLKKQLYELMTLFTDEFRESYGGDPITAFSIYVEPLENGAYVFYLLY